LTYLALQDQALKEHKATQDLKELKVQQVHKE
jgi:hypothetical protein